jgi:hypothetical protein
MIKVVTGFIKMGFRSRGRLREKVDQRGGQEASKVEENMKA